MYDVDLVHMTATHRLSGMVRHLSVDRDDGAWSWSIPIDRVSVCIHNVCFALDWVCVLRCVLYSKSLAMQLVSPRHDRADLFPLECSSHLSIGGLAGKCCNCVVDTL